VTITDEAPGIATGAGLGTATINFHGQMVLTSATEHTTLPNTTTIATFSDSNPGDTPALFNATIDWGDGTSSPGTVVASGPSFQVQGGHTYADEGSDPVSVTLTHTPDQAKSTVIGTVAVAEHDSLTPGGVQFFPIRGVTYNNVVATFTDSDHVTPASDFVATIDWGDGTTTPGTVSGSNGSFSVSGAHTYNSSGQKSVSVTVADDAPGTATTTAHSTAKVDVPPVAHNGSASGNEDTTINGAAVATDADNTQAQLTYSLVGTNGGATHGTASMDTHGAFSYTPAADYNGADSFQFRANDGEFNSNVATISLTINPVDDAPVITSNGGGDTAAVSVLERTTAVTTVVATDIDSPSVTYSISGGSDAAKFQIDSATGALSFITAPNFDAPADSDHNNSYVVQVSASDGTLADSQTLTVNVTDDPNVTSTLHWMKSVDVSPHPAGWQPAGIGDFNADGISDLAWFNASNGDLDIWKLANGQWASSSDVGSHPAGYQPVLFGDYNGDGTSDVLWFNPTTHDVDLWKISNGQWAGTTSLGAHPAGFTPALTGDFNGDGTSDVAWYNPTTNDIDLWKISNGQWAGSSDLGSHPAGSVPVLAGDFNGDGTSDIAWYNPTTHDLDIWLIKNGQWAGSVDAGSHPAGWQPLAAADFNLDGTSDIAWYNPTTNDIDVWLLNNGQWSASFGLGQHPGAAPGTAPLPGGGSALPGGGVPPAGSPSVPPVVAFGVGDFDHNGVGDVMWHDTGSGHLDNWLLAYS
jgi:VCBS repeat-containing protein